MKRVLVILPLSLLFQGNSLHSMDKQKVENPKQEFVQEISLDYFSNQENFKQILSRKQIIELSKLLATSCKELNSQKPNKQQLYNGLQIATLLLSETEYTHKQRNSWRQQLKNLHEKSKILKVTTSSTLHDVDYDSDEEPTYDGTKEEKVRKHRSNVYEKGKKTHNPQPNLNQVITLKEQKLKQLKLQQETFEKTIQELTKALEQEELTKTNKEKELHLASESKNKYVGFLKNVDEDKEKEPHSTISNLISSTENKIKSMESEISSINGTINDLTQKNESAQSSKKETIEAIEKTDKEIALIQNMIKLLEHRRANYKQELREIKRNYLEQLEKVENSILALSLKKSELNIKKQSKGNNNEMNSQIQENENAIQEEELKKQTIENEIVETDRLIEAINTPRSAAKNFLNYFFNS